MEEQTSPTTQTTAPTSAPAQAAWGMGALLRERAFRLACLFSLLAGTAWFYLAWYRWENFLFTTFDLAFYVQCLWNMLRGSTYSTLLDMPMLGNHADVIVLALVPIYALIPHHLTPVGVQVLLSAAMGPLGYQTARSAGLDPRSSLGLALTLVLTPAIFFAASFEFHPETLTAFFILLMYSGEVRRKPVIFWVGALATLACKENMALLLAAYAVVRAAEALYQSRWRPNGATVRYAVLLALSIGWFWGYEHLARPLMNMDKVEYGSLYNHLGGSMGSVLLSFFTDPAAVLQALSQSMRGELLWATLLPVALLPLLRPQWIIIAGPILAQHLLSERPSEWGITHHYAAPLLPLWWAAALEALLWLHRKFGKRPGNGEPRNQLWLWALAALPWIAVCLCVLTAYLTHMPTRLENYRVRANPFGQLLPETRAALLAAIPRDAAVFAGPPYLSHLAERQRIYSLQLLSKGTLTLSTQPYTPPTDAEFMLIDHADSSIFPLNAGFFHGPMTFRNGTQIPASDALIHQALRNGTWVTEQSVNEWSLYRRLPPGEAVPMEQQVPRENSAAEPVELGAGNLLHNAQAMPRELPRNGTLEFTLLWEFTGEREIFPWMELRLRPVRGPGEVEVPFVPDAGVLIARGLSLPQGFSNGALWEEHWQADLSVLRLPPGKYRLDLEFRSQTAALALQRKAANEGVPGNLRDPALGSVHVGEVVLR